MNATVVPLFLLLVLFGADDKPAAEPPAKLPLGKDTTYVTGPLDKQGYIDYESALNAELGRGVSPEKNANAALWQIFGPTPEGGTMPPDFFKWLDQPEPPRGGNYFVNLGAFGRNRLALTDAQFEALYEQMSRATQRPWQTKDNPVLAEWLKFSDKHLTAVAEAVKLPGYFNPLVSRHEEGEPASIIGSLLPGVQRCREFASALTIRAMLRLQDGKLDEAWQDILACHRLGRLLSRGGTMIEGLVGVAICQIASNATVTYAEHAKLSAKQAAERLNDLRNLPRLAGLGDKIDLTERFTGLESLQNVRRNGLGFLSILDDGETRKPTPEELKALAAIDWAPAMQAMNKWYDRLAAATRLTDRAAREKALDEIDKDLGALKRPSSADISKRLLAKDGPDKTVGTAISDTLIGLLMPAVRKVQSAHDRAEQVRRNLEVAFALAAYHADHGRYPAKLDDLAPTYLAAVPGDLFSDKPLVYKPAEKGYLFYSLGINGKDDGGQTYGDDPPGDDLVVRMPQPPLKKN